MDEGETTMMTKTIQSVILAVAMMACAARRTIPVTPTQQAQAVAIVTSGGSVRDVAVQLSLSDADARRLVRQTAHDLVKWLQTRDSSRGDRTVMAPVVVPAPGVAPATTTPPVTCDLRSHDTDVGRVGAR